MQWPWWPGNGTGSGEPAWAAAAVVGASGRACRDAGPASPPPGAAPPCLTSPRGLALYGVVEKYSVRGQGLELRRLASALKLG
jgi:hypothetical protein